MEQKKLNLIIGFTGSVASKRIVEIVNAFKKLYNIKIILTKTAKIFTDESINDYNKFEKENQIKIYYDNDEFPAYIQSKEILHIDLRRWADLILIAPLSANTLAKITNGLCDNLLVRIVL